AFRDFLIDSQGFAPDEVTLLVDAQAHSNAITTAMIDRLISETTPTDRIVLYFAGLGARVPDSSVADGDGLKEVLLAYDAPSVLGSIPRDAIGDILDVIPDHNVTVIIDASFDMPVGAHPTDAAMPRTTTLAENMLGVASYSEAPFGVGATDRAVWNAAAPGQTAWEIGGAGVFTKAFIEGVSTGAADSNGNGLITNAELLTFLRARSENWCGVDADCTATGTGLTPHFDGPVQDEVLMEVVPNPVITPQKEPKEAVLPVSNLQAKALSYRDTLGFVTDLFTPSNAAELKLSMSHSGSLKIGDTVTFTVDAEREGTLVLLDVNPDGELAQVFPSSLSKDDATRMRAGGRLIIPSGDGANGRPLRVRVSEPAGKGFLLALFVEDELPKLTAILPENIAGGPVPNAGQYLYEIAQDLLRLQADGSGNAPVEWSATYLPYNILP
ncbi:caspase family protein, partial [Litoreibacter sp.]|nr:caspase family protein [Litoreibacter sp.]